MIIFLEYSHTTIQFVRAVCTVVLFVAHQIRIDAFLIAVTHKIGFFWTLSFIFFTGRSACIYAN